MSVDLLFNKDLESSYSGDLILINGIETKKQSIVLRLKTKKGSNVFHPDYGNDLYSILSENVTETWIKKALSYVKECIEQDETVIVKSIKATFKNEKREIDFYIEYFLTEYSIEDSINWGEEVG